MYIDLENIDEKKQRILINNTPVAIIVREFGGYVIRGLCGEYREGTYPTENEAVIAMYVNGEI